MEYPKFKNKIEWNQYFDEIRALGISVIDDLFQVELMSSIIKKHIAKSFDITSLSFTDDGRCFVSLLSVDPNRQYQYLNIQENVSVLTTEGWARPVARYCEQLLNVEVEGKNALENLDSEIYKVGTGIDTKFVAKDNEGNYRDVITGHEFPAYGDSETAGIWDKDTKELLPGVIVYNDLLRGGHTVTNGQLKKHNITLVANNLDDFAHDDIWNLVTYDSAKIMCRGEAATPKEIAQANTRLSAYKAPSAPIYPVRTFGVLMQKLTFQNKKGGDQYRDGWGFLASEYLGEAFTNLQPDKYFFTPWACDGGMFQCRPWTDKIMAECVARAYITEWISHNLFQCVYLHRGHMTPEQKKNFIDGCTGKGPYAGKFVTIYENPDDMYNYDLVTDLNGLKAPFNPDKQSYLELLNMSDEEHDVEYGSRTSNQLVQSLMIADNTKTMEVLVRLADKFIEAKKKNLTNDEGHAPSWMDFQGNVDYQQVIGRTVPAFAHKMYAPLWHSLVDAGVKGYMKAIRKLNLPTAGAHAFVVPDSAADFGVRILGINTDKEMEIVCPVGSKHGYNRTVAVKYPKQHFAEYGRCRIITWEEYRNRVEANDQLSDLQKRLLIKHVRNVSPGAIMIPAIETLKNMLAGLDFDGDAVSLFFDKDIVDIMWKLTPKAVIIDEDDVSDLDAVNNFYGNAS